jgi:integrase
MAGHITRRTSKRTGKTTYQARLPHPTLKNKEVMKTFGRAKDAQRWLTERQAELLRGEFRDPAATNKPFTELVWTWRRTRMAKLAPKTRERYDSVVRTYLLPAFGATAVGKLSRADVKEFFVGLDGRGVSEGTQRKVQVVLSSILSEGVELGWLRENPAARLRLKRPARRPKVILTATEVRALADAMKRPADRVAVYVAAYTGLRAGELWALRRCDLDLDRRMVHVARALKDERGHLSFEEPKTEGSRRTVTLPRFVANLLTEHVRTIRDPEALIFTSPGGGNGRADGDGGPVRHGLFMRRAFRPAVKAALPPERQALRFHDLRHTAASLLIGLGANPKQIQDRMGHSSITTTFDLYGHLFEGHDTALLDALDAAHEEASNVVPLHREDEDPPVALAAV